MITPERRKEIEARVEAATPGPWEWLVQDLSMISLLAPNKGEMYEFSPILDCTRCEACQKNNPDVNDPKFLCGWPDKDDATFIAHARQDIPDLLAALAEAEAQRDRLAQALRECSADLEAEVNYRYRFPVTHPGLQNKYDRDIAPVVRAKAALEGVPDER